MLTGTLIGRRPASQVIVSRNAEPGIPGQFSTPVYKLERLKSASRVINVDMALATVTAAVARYRAMVMDLGNAPIDIAQAREVIREIADRIPVRPGVDGVPVAELAFNRELGLAQAVGAGPDKYRW